MTELFLCVRTFVVANRKFFLIWGLLQVALALSFHVAKEFSSGVLGSPVRGVFLTAYCAAYYGLVAYLGVGFNRHRKQSWLRQLPFSEAALLLAPITIIAATSFWYFATLNETWREGYISGGIAVVEFLLFLPLVNFICIKRARQPLMGAVVGVVITILFLFLHVIVLGQWNQENYGLVAEIPYWIVLVAMFLLLERKCLRGALFVGVVSACMPAMLSLYPYFCEPSSLRHAVADLKVIPSSAAISNFRAFATDAKYWKKSPGLYAKWRKLNLQSQTFAKEFLTDEELAAFLKNILDHADNFAVLKPYAQMFSGPDAMPLDRKDLSAKAKTYLVENWKDDEAHCHFLPSEPEQRFVKIALASKSCTSAIFGFFHKNPYPHLEKSKLELLDSILQSPRVFLSRDIRSAIEAVISNRSSFPKDVETLFTSNDWYRTPSFPTEALDLFKQYFRARERRQIAQWLTLERSDFVNAIDMASQRRGNGGVDRENSSYDALKYLCMHVSENCYGEAPVEMRGNFVFIVKRLWRLNGPSQNRVLSEVQFQLAKEILRPEHWSAIKVLKMATLETSVGSPQKP
jgi:hypothetical protein